jgi:hypothetical protein
MSGGGGKGGDTWRPTPVTPSREPVGGKGGGGVISQPDPCAIVEITNLNSPDRAVLATLRPGDLLDVAFQAGPPQRLVAQQATGQVAGSITSPSMLQIIQCITARGVIYVAEVLAVRGAICQVRVRMQ